MSKKYKIIISLILTFLLFIFLYFYLNKIYFLVVVSLIIISEAFIYLKFIKKINFKTKWLKLEKWFLTSVLGAIIISWLGTFLYGYVFPNTDAVLLQNQSTLINNNKTIVSKQDSIYELVSLKNEEIKVILSNIPNNILNNLEELAVKQQRKIEQLVQENFTLKQKLEVLSIEDFNVSLQNEIFLLFNEYRYKEVISLIDEFLNEKLASISDKDISKIYYQKSLANIGLLNYEDAINDIENALLYDNTNLTIIKEYGNLIKLSKKQNTLTPLKTIKKDYSQDIIISADKMNIFYRGVQNPISIPLSRFNTSDIEVKSNVGELTKAQDINKYNVNVTNVKASKIEITVKISQKDIDPIITKRTFRIKDITKPVATFRGEYGDDIKINRNNVLGVEISYILPNFLFDLNLEVNSYRLSIPNRTAILVRSNKIDQSAADLIKMTTAGEEVKIFDINVSIKGSNDYKLKNVAPMTLKVVQ